MMAKQLTVTTGALALLLGSGFALSQDRPTVSFQAVDGSVGGVPMMIIENEGLDEKHGFAGEFIFTPADSAFQNFLIGNIDISMDNDMIGVAIARAEGFDITAIYPVGNLYLGIIVPGDSDAETPKDLIGKRVGHFGSDSGTTSFIRVIVQDMYGFDVMDEYEFSQLGPAALVPMLENDRVDAIFNFESFASEAIHSTDGRFLLQAHKDYAEFTGGFSPWITNMIVHNDWLEEKPELAYAVRDAFDEAIQMLDESNYEILREDYIREGLALTNDEVLEVLIENARSTPYFTNEWNHELIDEGYEFMERLAAGGLLLDSVPEGVLTTLEEEIGPRP